MPVYVYQCRECGYDLEARQKFSDEPLTVCPNCGADTGLYRVVQPAGVVFKGSGFYITDSRGSKDSLMTPTSKKNDSGDSSSSDNGSGDKTAKTESTSESTSESKSETKSETKSDSKSETKSSSPKKKAAS